MILIFPKMSQKTNESNLFFRKNEIGTFVHSNTVGSDVSCFCGND